MMGKIRHKKIYRVKVHYENIEGGTSVVVSELMTLSEAYDKATKFPKHIKVEVMTDETQQEFPYNKPYQKPYNKAK
jgi:hypothetical protein